MTPLGSKETLHREPSVKTSLMFPKRVWKLARHYAVEHRMRLRDVVVRALEEYLARSRGDRRP
jgi:hypothetical protein